MRGATIEMKYELSNYREYGARIDFDVMGDDGKFKGGDYIIFDIVVGDDYSLITPRESDVERVTNRNIKREQVYLPLPPFYFRSKTGEDTRFDESYELKRLSAEVLSAFNKLFN